MTTHLYKGRRPSSPIPESRRSCSRWQAHRNGIELRAALPDNRVLLLATSDTGSTSLSADSHAVRDRPPASRWLPGSR
jgi:hypothetical protein